MKNLIIILFILLGLQTQAQQSPAYFCCDSITYTIDPSQGFNISLDTTGMVHNPDSIEVLWSVCNSSQCYSATGMFAYFGQIMTTDTLKVCYDAYLYENNMLDLCNSCDSLVYNGNSWVLLNMSNPTMIKEILPNGQHINVTYNLQGKVVNDIKKNTIYIRNMKKFIKF